MSRQLNQCRFGDGEGPSEVQEPADEEQAEEHWADDPFCAVCGWQGIAGAGAVVQALAQALRNAHSFCCFFICTKYMC